MTSENDCSNVAQAVGWALHALEPDEEIAVALHVPGCPSCQAAVRETEEVVAGLGFAAEQVEPPPGLRAAIMNAAVETPQNVPVRELPVATEPVRVRAPHSPVERAAQPATWLTRRRLVVAAAALVAVVAVGGLAVRNAQLEHVRTEQAQSISEIIGDLAPAGTQRAVLAAGNGATMGAVVLDNGVRKVVTVGMPPNAEASTTYVLWGIAGQAAPVALGTFDVTSTDARIQSVGSNGQNDGYTAYAVSIENGRTAPPAPSTVVAKGILV